MTGDRLRAASALFVLSGLVSSASSASSTNDAVPPKDLGLVERAERVLVQLTVRIRARAPQYRIKAAHLTKEDFSVLVDLEAIPSGHFDLDNFCPEPDENLSPERTEASKHLLLFVDRLRLEGQDNANAMIHDMIPQLAAEGYQMKILPNRGSEWTSDVRPLLRDAELIFDRGKRSAEASDEAPAPTVRALLESNDVDAAIALAQKEEFAAQRSFEGPLLQLARAISEMSALPMPKAMIYFADSGYSFRELIVDTAVRSGVAIYAVKADGMSPYVPNVKLVNDPGAIITTSLSSLSEHTGGAFSFGHFRKTASDRVLKRVRTDLSCVYVLSLDAAGFDRDRMLRPSIKLRSELKTQLIAETIPDVTIYSEKRQREEAVAIGLRSSNLPSVQPAAVSLVPTGFDGSRVTGLVQLALAPEPAALAIPMTWDLGINYFGASRVSGYGSRRVTSRASRFVFEKQVRLPIGPYSIVGIAQEVDGHGMARGTGVGILAQPKKNEVGFLHPLDIMQWGQGAFVSEDGNAQTAGWTPLRHAMANSDRPISLVVSLCRGKLDQEALTIEKSLLLPDDEIRFSPTDWPQERTAPCLVVRDDLLAAGRLSWSKRPYEATFVVKVNDASGKTVANASKAFWIIGPSREPAN